MSAMEAANKSIEARNSPLQNLPAICVQNNYKYKIINNKLKIVFY